MSDCKDQKYNIFNPSFSDETGNEVVDDPVTGSASAPIVVDVDAYDSIGDGTGVAKLTSSLGSSRLDITTTGAVTLGFTASSNTMNIDAPIYVTSGSDGRLAYYDGAGSQVNDAIDLYYDDINKRLGIQTLAPSASLTVSGSDDTKLFLVESDSKTNILDVSGSGHVGINTAAGNAALTINSNDSNVAHFKRQNAGNYLEIRNQLTTNGAILNAIDADLAFWHDNNETARMYEGGRMRFSSSAGGSSVEITGSGTGALLGVHSETKDNILYVAATGSIGIGTGTPGTVFGTSYSANVLQIKGRGNHVQLQLESQGSGTPAILMADGSGTTNTRTAFLQVAGDVFKLRSLEDNSTTRVDNIIVADLDNGYVGIGTSSPTRTLSVNGGASFYGDVDVTGTLTADKIVVSTTYVTSSIMFTSGSTKFGDTDDDTHQFTGSILVNGLLSSSSGVSASNLYLPKAGKLIFNSDASANNYFTADNTDDYVRLIMNNQTILTATDPGYIGINTSSPTANLEVTGTVNISGSANEQVLINDVVVGRGRKQGHRNTALGESALDEGTSSFGHNTAIGWWSQKNNPNGRYNTSVGASTLPNSTGYFNTAIGASSLASLSSGHSNTTAGYLAGSDLTSGFRNTLLGYNSKGPVDGYNMTAIGYAASASAQNEFVVGNSSITKLYNMGDNTSDLGQNSNRWKNLYVGSTLKVSGSSARLEVTGSDNSTLFGVHSVTNANILTVTGSGRVGIGTDDPQAALHVEGSQVYLPNEWVFASDTDTMIRKRTSNSIEFRLAGIDYYVIDATHGHYFENSNVGIGYTPTDTIPELLSVDGDALITGDLTVSGTMSASAGQFSTVQTNWIDFNALAGSPAYSEGRLFYNDDEKHLSYWTDLTDIELDLTQQMAVRTQNNTGGFVSGSLLVHFTGSTGTDTPRFVLADYSTELTSFRTIGMTVTGTNNGDQTYAIAQGVVTQVDTSAYTSGDILYLSSSGSFTNVKPTFPNHSVRIGEVIRVHHNQGSIYINVMNGFEVEELHNTNIQSASYGDLLAYNSTSPGSWENTKQLSGSYGMTGSLDISGSLSASSIYLPAGDATSDPIGAIEAVGAGRLKLRSNGIEGLWLDSSGNTSIRQNLSIRSDYELSVGQHDESRLRWKTGRNRLELYRDVSGVEQQRMHMNQDGTFGYGDINHSASAIIHISGSDNASLFKVGSDSYANIINVSGSGYIGINSAPVSGYRLNVNGDVRVQNSRVLAEQFVWYSNSSLGYIKWDDGQLFNGVTRISASANARLEVTGSDNSTLFGVHSTSKENILVVTGSGRVSINPSDVTAVPTAELNVRSIGNSNVLKMERSDIAGVSMIARIATDCEWNVNSKDLLIVHNYGENVRFSQNGAVRFSSSLGTSRLEITGSDNSVLFGIHSPSNADILTVTGSGRVGIGTSNPSYELDVGGTIQCTTLIETSARQLKEDITPQKSELNNIMKLNPVDFNWKKDNKKSKGFIAEEVQEVYPELVAKNKDGRATGIEYAKMVSVLTQGMKELNKMVAKQQETIERLVKKIEGKS